MDWRLSDRDRIALLAALADCAPERRPEGQSNLQRLEALSFAHARLKVTVELVINALERIEAEDMVDPETAETPLPF